MRHRPGQLSTTEVSALIDETTRTIENWPVEGVTFRDITPLLGHSDAFAAVIGALRDRLIDLDPDVIVGVEARGFIVGAPLALELDIGFVPVRKLGKLPARTHQATYDLEYGTATLEIHADAMARGARAVLVDDVLATGGTMAATQELVRRCGADPIAIAVMIEIAALGGRGVLDLPVHTLRSY